jgi:molybdopterin molybdotransferase
MVGFREAFARVMECADPLDRTEVELSEAYGSVLAEDVHSDIDIPPFDKSAMDGYAVRSADIRSLPQTLEVGATIAAGEGRHIDAVHGACVRIMTGAPVPQGLDAVVMFEDTEEKQGKVLFTRPVESGQNICRRGEDVARGQRVLDAGSLIGGPEIAILASTGRIRVSVTRRPVVYVLTTGSEIVEPQEQPGHGMIRNSNGPMLSCLVSSTGARVRYLGIGSDRPDELAALIEEGLRGDVLLISGGVSMGDYDLVPGLIRDAGLEILLHRVKIKPGKPLLLAKGRGCVVIGVPGNPVSNFTTFHSFVKPALFKMMGRAERPLHFVEGRLEVDLLKRGERAQLMPSRYRVINGRYEVAPLKLNGSADIAGCAGCNCLLFLEEGEQRRERGDTVPLLLIEA